jgi:hypothetical protein
VVRLLLEASTTDEVRGITLYRYAGVLGDALYSLLEHRWFNIDDTEIGSVFGDLISTMRTGMLRVLGWPVYLPTTETSGDRLATFLRPLDSVSYFPLENRFDSSVLNNIGMPTKLPRLSIETILNCALSNTFTCYSIGGPLDPLGMGRLFPVQSAIASREEAWLKAATHLTELSNLVILLPGPGPGIRKELVMLRRHNLLHKVVLCMLPTPRYCYDIAIDEFQEAEKGLYHENQYSNELFRRLAIDWPTWQMDALCSGIRLPPYDSAGGFYFFSEDGIPTFKLEFDCVWNGGLLNACTSLCDHAAYMLTS